MRDVIIVIPNLNGESVLGECLAAIPAAMATLSWQTVVVDNASTDRSRDVVQESFPEVKVVANSENLGFAAACNLGAKDGQSRYVLLLNSDVTLSEGSIAALVAHAERHPEAGAVSPQMCWPDGSPQGPLLGLSRFWKKGPPYALSWLPGTCLLLRREALDRVGWLDEDFFFYNEDLDLSWRLRKGGYRLDFLPAVKVHHINGHATGLAVDVRARAIAEGYRGSVLLAQKHQPWSTPFVRLGLRLAVAAQRVSLGLKRKLGRTLSAREEATLLATQRLKSL